MEANLLLNGILINSEKSELVAVDKRMGDNQHRVADVQAITL